MGISLTILGFLKRESAQNDRWKQFSRDLRFKIVFSEGIVAFSYLFSLTSDMVIGSGSAWSLKGRKEEGDARSRFSGEKFRENIKTTFHCNLNGLKRFLCKINLFKIILFEKIQFLQNFGKI